MECDGFFFNFAKYAVDLLADDGGKEWVNEKISASYYVQGSCI